MQFYRNEMICVKRAVSLFLVLIMLLSVTACSGGESSEDSPLKWCLQDTEEYYGGLFGHEEILRVDVNLEQSDWETLCSLADAEEYCSASVTVNGVTADNIGFRAKGNSSLIIVLGSDSNRYGFKIKTDEYAEGQTLNGLDMFVLNNCYNDSSYMREYITYACAQKLGLITPFVSYANVYINGELLGFYLMVEAFDDSFVQRVTSDPDAVLYKAKEETCTLLPEDDGSGFGVNYGSDKERVHIRELVEVLNSTDAENKADLEAILDVDSCLKAFALNAVLCNYDSYSGNRAHNYYLLYSEGRFSYVGWDYNTSLGCYGYDNGDVIESDIMTGVYDTELSERPLIGKLLAIDEYRDRYLSYVDELCGMLENFTSTVSWLDDLISDSVKKDPSNFYSYEFYRTAISGKEGDVYDEAKDSGELVLKAGNVTLKYSIVYFVKERLKAIQAQR